MPVTVVTAAEFINVTMRAIDYINEVNNASKERATLAAEAAGLLSLLCEFQERARYSSASEPWFQGACSPERVPGTIPIIDEELGGKTSIRERHKE